MKIRMLLIVFLLWCCQSVTAETLQLPFSGRWLVSQGGDTPNVNHHMGIQAQWYGVDFAKNGGPYGRSLAEGKADKVEDFYCRVESRYRAKSDFRTNRL